MSLTDVLRREQPAGTDAEVAAWLAESVGTRDDTLYTMAYLPLVLGTEASALVLGTLRVAGESNPLIWAATQKLCSTGIDFGEPLVQQMIDLLADSGSWSSELRAAVKAIGIVYAPRWQMLGLPSEPTEADVTAARAKLAVSEFPLQGVLLSLNLSPTGRVSASLRVTPSAVAEDGEVLPGTPTTVAFSGALVGLELRRKTLADAILAAVATYLEGE